MRRIVRWGAALGLLVLAASLAPARAQSIDVVQHRFETTLVVQALPLHAEVLIDGQRLGSAQELNAVAIAVRPGPHVLQVIAPGHEPYTGRFVADISSSVNQFRVTLAPR